MHRQTLQVPGCWLHQLGQLLNKKQGRVGDILAYFDHPAIWHLQRQVAGQGLGLDELFTVCAGPQLTDLALIDQLKVSFNAVKSAVADLWNSTVTSHDGKEEIFKKFNNQASQLVGGILDSYGMPHQ
ncbi:hypothetical protein DSO57_1002097 [Entomophthora muscae]|uniref:Uncharacterized protein n=1 Tax=Entomophthora muscae TaxID=34485 RepID=A0ACC2TW47_9FUNG|nr:hypothetical protein DSO57_1002097 [Entomophthora muscae]